MPFLSLTSCLTPPGAWCGFRQKRGAYFPQSRVESRFWHTSKVHLALCRMVAICDTSIVTSSEACRGADTLTHTSQYSLMHNADVHIRQADWLYWLLLRKSFLTDFVHSYNAAYLPQGNFQQRKRNSSCFSSSHVVFYCHKCAKKQSRHKSRGRVQWRWFNIHMQHSYCMSRQVEVTTINKGQR